MCGKNKQQGERENMTTDSPTVPTSEFDEGIKFVKPPPTNKWGGFKLPTNLIKVRPLLENHFGGDAPLDEFFDKILDMGGTTNEALALCTWEDLQKCGLPILLAKQVALEFRQPTGCSTNIGTNPFVGKREAARMSIEELLEKFDIHVDDSPVAVRLKDLSKGKKFIVLTSTGTVDVKVSTALLEELRKGYPPREWYVSGRDIFQVFAVGEKPNTQADENPLYPGRALRPDGTCDQLNRSWEGVPLAVRQLVWFIAKETKLDHSERHDIMDWALNQPEKLHQRYHGPNLSFKLAEQHNTLPNLRVSLNQPSRKQNPFSKE